MQLNQYTLNFTEAMQDEFVEQNRETLHLELWDIEKGHKDCSMAEVFQKLAEKIYDDCKISIKPCLFAKVM